MKEDIWQTSQKLCNRWTFWPRPPYHISDARDAWLQLKSHAKWHESYQANRSKDHARDMLVRRQLVWNSRKDMTRMKSCTFLFDDVANCLVDPLKDRRAGCPAGLISIGHLVLLLEHTKVVQVAPSCTKLHLSRPWNSWTWRNYVVTFLAQIHVLDSPVGFFEGCPLWQGILSIKPIVLHCPPVKIKHICFWMELQSSFVENLVYRISGSVCLFACFGLGWKFDSWTVLVAENRFIPVVPHKAVAEVSKIGNL